MRLRRSFLTRFVTAAAVIAFFPLLLGSASSRNDKTLDASDEAMINVMRADYGIKEAMAYQAMGGHYMKAENGRRAERYYQKAVKKDPSLYVSWHALGLLHISENKKALSYFQRAVRIKPDFAEPYYWIAFIYARSRKDKEAMDGFVKYLGVARADDPAETKRLEIARLALVELRSGRDGMMLSKIRPSSSSLGSRK